MSKEKLMKILPILLISIFALLKILIYSNLLDSKGFLRGDDAIYAILSQRILNGDFFSAFNPYWNAGFPLATIPFYLITGSFEKAQLLLSMAAHITLIIVIFFTLKKFSYLLAIIASFLTAFSPSFTKLVLYGGMSEPLYILVLWVAIYFGWQTLIDSSKRSYALAGMFFGLAYFIRTEAIYTFSGFCVVTFLSQVLQRRSRIKVFNKITAFSLVGAAAAYFYFPMIKLSKFTTFGFMIFRSTKGVVLAIPFLIVSFLSIVFELRKFNWLLFKNIILKFSIMIALFILINLPYITIISINLGKPTLSGKYAYIGSSHPFTPEKDRLTTWAQDIWSIDFPNYRSPYYDSTKTLPLMWKNIENSIEAFIKRIKTNWDFYGNDNVFTNSEVAFIIFGLFAAAIQKRFRIFALYLAFIWFISFVFITYFMDAAIRYIAFAYPIMYTFYSFAVMSIAHIFSKVNKIFLPLTVLIFLMLFFDKNFDPNSLHTVKRDVLETSKLSYDQKEIGDWLKSQEINLFMGRTEGIELYAEAKMVYMPAANPETIVQFAKAWGVEYLVARPHEASWDYMRIIVNPEFTHPDLELKHKFKDGTLIWKVKLTEKEKLHNFRTTKDVNKRFEGININSQMKI